MEVVGNALLSLIKILIPDNEQHHPTTPWVKEELQPLLYALEHKSSKTQDNLATNYASDSIIQIALGAVILLLVIISIVAGYCIRNNTQVNARLSDGVPSIYNKLGTRAPNSVPAFRI